MNRNLLKKYIPKDRYQTDQFSEIKNVPLKVALRLPTGYGYVNRREQWNKSPTIIEIFAIAQMNNGTLDGYIIPFASGRSDPRITFDCVTVKLPAYKAYAIAHKFQPTEFSEPSKDLWRFWWD